MNNSSHDSDSRIPRRKVMQWFAAAAAGTAAGVPAFSPAQTQAVTAAGYGSDPNLMAVYNPGDVWPLTFSNEEQALVTALADTILPEDDYGPAASKVRVPEYIDEWISAPYPNQQRDREVFVPGLARFEAFAKQTFNQGFADLSEAQRKEICKRIVSADETSPDAKALSRFFHSFTMIASGAYFSTTEGWKAIGYLGNMASGVFSGPPQEVLDRVGVEQTVVAE